MAEFLPEAAAEMSEAAAFYERRRPGLGERFLDLVEATVRRIEDAPLAGSPWPAKRTRVVDAHRWMLPGFPFAVVYVTMPEVVVVAIAHTKRRPGYWLPRLHQGR